MVVRNHCGISKNPSLNYPKERKLSLTRSNSFDGNIHLRSNPGFVLGKNEENKHRHSVLITDQRKVDENVVLKEFEKVRLKLSICQTLFCDETFSASNQSIYINGISFSKTTLDFLPNEQKSLLTTSPTQWLRPNDIHPPTWNHNSSTQWNVFRNPKPNDVLQGALGLISMSFIDEILVCVFEGDCWFITALSVLAEQPDYLMKVCFILLFFLVSIFIENEGINYEGI